MSEPVLLFRGEVQSASPDEIIIDAMLGSSGSTRLQVAGKLTNAVLRVTKLAARPQARNDLVDALEREFPLEDGVAFTLVEQLIAAGVLESEVNTTNRLSIHGHSELADELRTRLAAEYWPADLPGCDLVILGRLGSADWKRELDLSYARNTPVLTCSFEGNMCWIGPLVGTLRGPCPFCLHARRVAARREAESPIAVSCPPNLSLVSALLRQVAEHFARGELAADRVLHVEETSATWRTLLPQPHCEVCDPVLMECAPELAKRAQQTARDFEDQLNPVHAAREPTEAQRAAFLDPAIGPLTLEVYDRDGSFRDLPLVLGSIRSVESDDDGLKRWERPSVMFGTGATEHRRKLVAFSEGIERYAGSSERPDIVAATHQELSPFALHPEQTVRFSAEQYASLALERYTGQPTDWSWTCDWTTGEPKLLIHDAISSSARTRRGSFRVFQDPFASGMAAHRSLELAVSRAALELIERDAMMLAWYLRLPLRPLEVSTLRVESGADAELHELIAYLERGGVDVSFYDLRVDFSVPTVLAVAEAKRDFGVWKAGGKILSACAGLSFGDALRHALRELLGHYTVFALVSPDGDKSTDPETGAQHAWWPAFASLLSPRDDDPLGFLAGGSPLVLRGEPTVPLSLVRDELAAREVPLYVRQLGRADVRGSGLVAIRAVAPGLLRLTPTRTSMNLGEPRIETVRRAWGALPGLNPLPHPLG